MVCCSICTNSPFLSSFSFLLGKYHRVMAILFCAKFINTNIIESLVSYPSVMYGTLLEIRTWRHVLKLTLLQKSYLMSVYAKSFYCFLNCEGCIQMQITESSRTKPNQFCFNIRRCQPYSAVQNGRPHRLLFLRKNGTQRRSLLTPGYRFFKLSEWNFLIFRVEN